MTDTQRILCECGQPADADACVWNGKDHLPVCIDCYHSKESIATETCVRFAEVDHTMDGKPASLEECLRVELGFREREWTPELQAFIDKCYIEWYMEET